MLQTDARKNKKSIGIEKVYSFFCLRRYRKVLSQYLDVTFSISSHDLGVVQMILRDDLGTATLRDTDGLAR